MKWIKIYLLRNFYQIVNMFPAVITYIYCNVKRIYECYKNVIRKKIRRISRCCTEMSAFSNIRLEGNSLSVDLYRCISARHAAFIHSQSRSGTVFRSTNNSGYYGHANRVGLLNFDFQSANYSRADFYVVNILPLRTGDSR